MPEVNHNHLYPKDAGGFLIGLFLGGYASG